MLYHNTKTGEFGISLGKLRQRFPNISIPTGSTHVGEYEMYVYSPRPEANILQIVREVTPKDHKQQWVVEDAPEYVINQRADLRVSNAIEHRRRLLLDCDWTQLPDALPIEQQHAWSVYRQQLRNLDVHSGFVVWPDKPE